MNVICAAWTLDCLRHIFSDLLFTVNFILDQLQTTLCNVPSRVGNLRKMRNFWANFTDFEPEISIIKCKTEKLEYFNARLYLGKANLKQKICKRGPQSSEIFGQKFQ